MSQSPYHPVYLVLHHFEAASVGGSTECSVCLLILLIASVVVVAVGEVCKAAVVGIAFVSNSKSTTCSKAWSIATVTVYRILWLCECHFLLEVYWQQEAWVGVVSLMFTSWVPLQGSVARDGFAELSLDQRKSMLDVVAGWMEFGSQVAVLWGSEA